MPWIATSESLVTNPPRYIDSVSLYRLSTYQVYTHDTCGAPHLCQLIWFDSLKHTNTQTYITLLVRTWSSVVFSFCVVFFFLALTLRDFSLYVFLFLYWLISRTEGLVWRGWMTNLLCSFFVVWRQGAGHSWRTQSGDGSLGSKVPGGLAGGTWLYYSYHKRLEGALGFALPVIFPRLFSLCSFFPRFFVLLCLRAVWCFSYLFFFPARPFSSVGQLACAGRAPQIVSSSLLSFFSLSVSIGLLCFWFLSDCFLSFFYLINYVCRASRI